MVRVQKLKYTPAVLCGVVPKTEYPDQKKWFEYGRETGLLTVLYNNTKDPALLEQIMQRCETEADAWLRMVPPDYAGAAKQWINLEASAAARFNFYATD